MGSQTSGSQLHSTWWVTIKPPLERQPSAYLQEGGAPLIPECFRRSLSMCSDPIFSSLAHLSCSPETEAGARSPFPRSCCSFFCAHSDAFSSKAGVSPVTARWEGRGGWLKAEVPLQGSLPKPRAQRAASRRPWPLPPHAPLSGPPHSPVSLQHRPHPFWFS